MREISVLSANHVLHRANRESISIMETCTFWRPVILVPFNLAPVFLATGCFNRNITTAYSIVAVSLLTVYLSFTTFNVAFISKFLHVPKYL